MILKQKKEKEMYDNLNFTLKLNLKLFMKSELQKKMEYILII